MRMSQVDATGVKLHDLDGVLAEVAQLEQNEGEQERKEAVVLVLPDVLEGKDQDPGDDGHGHDAIQGVALDDRADLKDVRDRCGDQNDTNRQALDAEDAGKV